MFPFGLSHEFLPSVSCCFHCSCFTNCSVFSCSMSHVLLFCLMFPCSLSTFPSVLHLTMPLAFQFLRFCPLQPEFPVPYLLPSCPLLIVSGFFCGSMHSFSSVVCACSCPCLFLLVLYPLPLVPCPLVPLNPVPGSLVPCLLFPDPCLRFLFICLLSQSHTFCSLSPIFSMSHVPCSVPCSLSRPLSVPWLVSCHVHCPVPCLVPCHVPCPLSSVPCSLSHVP